MRFYFFMLPTLLICSFNPVRSQSGAEVTRQMFKATKRIKTLTYTMRKEERINGDIKTQIATVKLQRNPFKVYSRQIEPNEGIEVLYIRGESNALINPNGFPWFNIKLDPYGSRMRKDQHHTINDAGYDHVVSILEHLLDKYEARLSSMIEKKSSTCEGRPCWIIELKNPEFKYQQYRVKEGEDIVSIADKFKLSGHMIIELNDDIDGYYDVSAGQTITIPNGYSPRMILHIDKKLKVPLVMKVYDDKGLYEHYKYNEIHVNPKLNPEEFTANYHAYDF